MHIENFLSILKILNTVIKCDVCKIEGLGAIISFFHYKAKHLFLECLYIYRFNWLQM